MNLVNKILIPISLTCCFGFLWSCSESVERIDDVFPVDKKKNITGITLELTTRGDGDSQDSEFKPEDYIPYELKFDENTRVFISQQPDNSKGIPSAFQSEDVIYSYSYIPGRESATWEQGENFGPTDIDNPLNWETISNGGVFNGGFSLYAMLFPESNEIQQRVTDDNTIHYFVQKDQSTIENLKKSDILGAYHSTDNLFTRLRFKLFHLMTYVRIKLYVPVYDAESMTGFFADALDYAEINNATTEFTVEWKAYLTTESAPRITALNGEEEIKMYQHHNHNDAGEEIIEETEIEWKKYIPDNFFDQPLTTDKDRVKVYEFSVIIPMQKGLPDSEDPSKETQYASTNFLNFYLRSNAPGVIHKYYFNQSFYANSNESSLELSQGNFQYLELYVPRIGNELILVKAHLNEWEHRSTGSFPLKEVED